MRRSAIGCSSAALMVMGLILGPISAGLAQAQANDHLQCYQVKGSLKLKGTVDLRTRQFVKDLGCKITKPKFFCAPATKFNVDVKNAFTKDPITPLPFSALPAPGDRICYKIKCPKQDALRGQQIQVTDQFGTHLVKNAIAKMICTPAMKGPRFCGDGGIDVAGGEECEATKDQACPGRCLADCTCGPAPAACPATGQMTCYDNNGSVILCTDTGHDGEIQAGAPLSYTDNTDGTITDDNTGLTWEKKSDDGTIHDQDTSYTWVDAFAVHLAGLNDPNDPFAGFTDWRMPNVKELQDLVDYEVVNPSVDAAFDTGCAPACTVLNCSCTFSGGYVTSTSTAINPANVFRVFFTNGNVFNGQKTDLHFVRAVRGP